jgi:hypothetical protein
VLILGQFLRITALDLRHESHANGADDDQDLRAAG